MDFVRKPGKPMNMTELQFHKHIQNSFAAAFQNLNALFEIVVEAQALINMVTYAAYGILTMKKFDAT
eukprot:c39210_g1_i1 orf=20-220(-)